MAYQLHRVVSTFCDETDEIPIYEDDQWFEQAADLMTDISELFLEGPARKEFSGLPTTAA